MSTRKPPGKSLTNQEILHTDFGRLSYTEIAQKYGISRQRIQQLLSPPSAIRKYIYNKHNDRCVDCGKYVGKSGHIHHTQLDKNGANYQDIDNLILLCNGCYKKRHGIPLITKRFSCSFCKNIYEKSLGAELRRSLLMNKSGLHFCSRTCQGKWLALNHGFKRGENGQRRGKKKYDYEQVYNLRITGFSGIKISQELDIPESTVYKILSSMPKNFNLIY